MDKKSESKEIIALMREIVKRALEEMMIEERKEYLGRNPDTKGNGYYMREIICGLLGIEDLKVPRTRDGNFRSVLLPYRKKYTEDMEDVIKALFIAGVSQRKLVQMLRYFWSETIGIHDKQDSLHTHICCIRVREN